MSTRKAKMGFGLAKLAQDYDQIVRIFPDGQPALQCDPRAILSMITEGVSEGEPAGPTSVK